MKKILAEPLVHFFLIGALLFGLFAVMKDSGGSSREKIVISENDREALQANFARTWQRNPTKEELDGLVEDKIRNEIAYREALAMGLDKDDPYIRQRLRMKMELLFEDINSLNPPTDKELESFLEQNQDEFREEARISFSHIYLDAAKHKKTLEHDVEALLALLDQSTAPMDLEAYGDPTMLPKTYGPTPVSVIDRQFGAGFSSHLDPTRIGVWQGPIPSGYGYHLVMINDYRADRTPELADIKAMVEREYLARQRKEFKEVTYAKLREKYEIVRETADDPNS